MMEPTIAFILMALKFAFSFIYIKKIIIKDKSKLIKNYMIFMLIKNFFLIGAYLAIINFFELENTKFILYMMLFYFISLSIELYIINQEINNK